MNIPLTLQDLRAAYDRDVRPETIIEQVYARMTEVADPGIFISLRDKAEVLAEAAALAPRGRDQPLWGVPFAVKDNIDVAGLPTTAACPAWEYTPDADAFTVARLRAAGAIVIGKTNLDQFATGLVGVRSPYPVPKNAIDPLIVPGGSSSGSAVAVAQGIVAFALGTDTAGSGRVPAALNNIVGLKPSLGSWSATGCIPACRSIETISAFALTVADAYLVHQIAAGFDPADAYCRDIPAPAATLPARPLRIGVPDAGSIRFFGDEAQADSFADSLSLLTAAGHEIAPVDFTPLYAIADMLYSGAWVAERHSVIEDLLRDEPEAVLPVTAGIIRKAESLSATDAFRGMYRLKELERQVAPVLAGLDLLCVPTIPTFYSLADLSEDPITPNSNFGTYTNFVNLLDMCGIAVPTPPRSDGRPGSVTLLAGSGKDWLLAGLAPLLERAAERSLGATGWTLPEAEKLTPDTAPLPPGFMKLAVCGAHMSGLPLNHQLTSRGGYLLGSAVSAPYYRFVALSGGAVPRPGMIRSNDRQDHGIHMEIWALPQDTLGSFILGIPAPLGLGQVELADGARVTGFVCEASAADDAEDITGIGNWRNYLESM